MSERTASRRRHAWLPNRMFDPVANPFAVQNLLEKESQPFTVQRDARGTFAFAADPLLDDDAAAAFRVDETIDPPAFDGESVDAGASMAPAFSADADAGQAGFEADAETAPRAAAWFESAEDESSPDAANAAMARTTEAAAHADDVDSPDLTTTADTTAASPGSPVQAAAPADTPDTPDSADLSAASPGANHDQTPADAPQANADADAHAGLATMPTSVDSAPTSAAVAQQPLAEPDLSSPAVRQLVEAAREEARAEAATAAYHEGVQVGLTQAMNEMHQAHEQKLAQLQTLIDALQKLSFDVDALFDPVKQLTVHLAEQLVRGELSQAPQAISRLVDNCLRELNASGEKAVVVHLHPEDLELYRPLVAQFGDTMILRPDALLQRGSVRTSLDGSVVEDLMQRRVDGLKKSLAQPAAPGWRGGAKLADRLADGQRGSQQVEDVTTAEIVAGTTDDGHA